MKNNQFLICSLLLIILTAFCSISYSAEEYRLKPKEVMILEIEIDPSDKEVYSFQYELSFNPEDMELISQEEGIFLKYDNTKTYVINKIENREGKAQFGCTRLGSQKGVTEAATAAIIKFKPKDTEKSEIMIKNIKIVTVKGSELEARELGPITRQVIIDDESKTSSCKERISVPDEDAYYTYTFESDEAQKQQLKKKPDEQQISKKEKAEKTASADITVKSKDDNNLIIGISITVLVIAIGIVIFYLVRKR
ncbi:MAG: hypothetical protein KAK00_03720 [Nanoarchaeota archaeon]|nr:hypothetical protein [Nanoarchaeota archaeon]